MRSLTNLTDQQLIHLFMDGDSEALETLIVRHKDKIYTSIFLLVKDKYLAEDIFQDVFIRVIDTVRIRPLYGRRKIPPMGNAYRSQPLRGSFP